MSIAKLASGRESYYLATVASASDGRPGLIEPEGRWLGRGAAGLSLSGAVEKDALRALMAGVDPATGEMLSASQRRVRVAAYDCTYSTPKSVSVLHALGPEDVQEQVRAGHERAAEAALGYLERAARVRRTVAAGRQLSVSAEGFVAASFLHRTSRAPDPHLHSHVLVANLARGPDGRWSALDGRCLYVELSTARHLYETHLRGELTRSLGVSWRQLRGWWADLEGIDPKLNREFSRRSEEIREALRESGREGPRAARIAATRTRAEKDLDAPYERLVDGWRERSYRLGVSDARIAAVAARQASGDDGRDAHYDIRAETSVESWAKRELGATGTLLRRGACTRNELIMSRCGSLRLGAPIPEVERELDGLIAAGRLLAVPESGLRPLLRGAVGRIPSGVAQPRYTTPEVLSLHERVTALVREHPGAVELCAYQPGERLGALDGLSALASMQHVEAAAPGRAASARFESVTGIETVDLSLLGEGLPPATARGKQLLVVAEAHHLGPAELTLLLGPRIERGERTVLLAPAACLDGRRFSTLATLAPYLPGFSLPVTGERALHMAEGTPQTDRFHFGGREVLVVPDAATAREAMLACWRLERVSARGAVLVVDDEAVLQALRKTVLELGGSADEVLGTREFTSGRTGRSTTAVILGAVPESSRAGRSRQPVQVLVVAPGLPADERLARAAEVCRAPYLTAELGKPPRDPAGRSVWRAAAVSIEKFRRTWAIDDPQHATGTPSLLRSLGPRAVAEAAECRLEVRRETRSVLSRPQSMRGMSRELEAPSRSR